MLCEYRPSLHLAMAPVASLFSDVPDLAEPVVVFAAVVMAGAAAGAAAFAEAGGVVAAGVGAAEAVAAPVPTPP